MKNICMIALIPKIYSSELQIFQKTALKKLNRRTHQAFKLQTTPGPSIQTVVVVVVVVVVVFF